MKKIVLALLVSLITLNAASAGSKSIWEKLNPFHTEVSSQEAVNVITVLDVESRWNRQLADQVKSLVDNTGLPSRAKKALEKKYVADFAKKFGWSKVRSSFVREIKNLPRQDYLALVNSTKFKEQVQLMAALENLNSDSFAAMRVELGNLRVALAEAQKKDSETKDL